MTIKLMNGKLLLAVACMLLFVALGQAQPSLDPEAAARQTMNSPITQEILKNGARELIRSEWNGKGANLQILGMVLHDPEIRTAFNVSDEQYQQVHRIVNRTWEDEDPAIREIEDEIAAMQSQSPNDPFMQNADEETQKKMSDLQMKRNALALDFTIDLSENILTQEQKQKVKESQLASMSEIPFLMPSMFEALNLTDVQKRRMEQIKKELEPEFEKTLESTVNHQMALMRKMFAEHEKQVALGNTSSGQENLKKVLADPEFKKIRDGIQTQNKQFSTQFRIKMFDVLTDEQWARLQQLIDNPPEHALVLRKKLREQQGKSEESEKSSVWIPGPGAWQPGSSAIPEQYRQERNTRSRFPRDENPSP